MKGCIHKRVRMNAAGKETARWYVVLDVDRTESGRRQQKWHGGFTTRREAEIERARIVNEIRFGTYVAPNRITLDQWVRETWLPTICTRIKPTTYESYRSNMHLHILPTLGGRRLIEITPLMLNRLYADLLAEGTTRGPLCPTTVRYIHAIVSKALCDAVDGGVLQTNVSARAKPPRPQKNRESEIQCWEPDELATFLESVRGDNLEVAWQVAAMTGMRRGEVLGLRWCDIDFDGARLTARRSIVAASGTAIESSVKNGLARTVALDSGTLSLLRRERDRHLNVRSGSAAWDPNTPVVTGRSMAQMHPRTLTRQFALAVERAGVRRIRLHDLRHTHATIAIRAGVPISVISERLGHRSAAFTLSQYVHVLPGMQAQAAEAISSEVFAGR